MNIDNTTKVYLGGVEQVRIMKNGSVIWEKQQDNTDYFYIQNTYAGQNTVSLTTGRSGSPTSGNYSTSVQYSKDKTNWTTISNLAPGYTHTITIDQGEKVYFRNDNGVFNFYNDSNSASYYTYINSTYSTVGGGNLASLIDYTNMDTLVLPMGCFYRLFYNNTTITTLQTLPSNAMGTRCCFSMFENCTGLITPPALPSMTLAKDCYGSLFLSCSNLTTPPELPATTLVWGCYGNMFKYCGSLTSAPVLHATTLTNFVYSGMFIGCNSLTTPPELPATNLGEGCYQYMFERCSNLTTTPVLPATTLVTRCYQYMFNDCRLVDSVIIYANDNSATDCTKNWLNGVAATGTFNNFGTATYTPNSASGIPSGWTEHTSL